MTSIDEQITHMLHQHADDTPIEDNLDVILSDGHLVRFSPAGGDAARSKSQFLVAAATVVIVAAGAIGIVQLSRIDSSPASGVSDGEPTSESPTPTLNRAFPVLGSVPEIDATIYGNFVSYAEPYATSAVIARRDGDRLVDVTAIYAVVANPGDDMQLVPPDAQITNGTLGVFNVTVYDNAGGRWYRWIDGQVTVLIQASRDSEMIASALSVSVNGSTGLVDVELGDLPNGLEVISSAQAQIGTQPSLSTDDAQLDLFVTATLSLVDSSSIDGYDVVEVNGNEGFATPLGEGSMVTWRSGDGTWMRLSASAIGPNRLLEIAREVTYVDQTAWERTYNTDFPTSPNTPTTTEP